MQTMTRPARVATPVRWERALTRAAAHGVAPRRVGTDLWAVASSAGTLVYLVAASADGLTCTCKAGAEGDPVCWHRAAVLAVATETPEPPTTGGPAVRRCHKCGGRDSAGMCPLCCGAGAVAA